MSFVKTVEDDNLKYIVNIMIAEAKERSIAQIAKELGYKENTFRSALANNAMRVRDLVKVANHLGFKVVIVPNNEHAE